MSDQEYAEALDYLLKKIQAPELIDEINQLINRGKTRTITSSIDLRQKKIKQSEVGKTQTLPLTSKEAFEVAIAFLSKIIIDVPSYSHAISATFGQNVYWELDQSKSLKEVIAFEPFSLNSLNVDQAELASARNELSRIGELMKED